MLHEETTLRHDPERILGITHHHGNRIPPFRGRAGRLDNSSVASGAFVFLPPTQAGRCSHPDSAGAIFSEGRDGVASQAIFAVKHRECPVLIPNQATAICADPKSTVAGGEQSKNP